MEILPGNSIQTEFRCYLSEGRERDKITIYDMTGHLLSNRTKQLKSLYDTYTDGRYLTIFKEFHVYQLVQTTICITDQNCPQWFSWLRWLLSVYSILAVVFLEKENTKVHLLLKKPDIKRWCTFTLETDSIWKVRNPNGVVFKSLESEKVVRTVNKPTNRQMCAHDCGVNGWQNEWLSYKNIN